MDYIKYTLKIWFNQRGFWGMHSVKIFIIHQNYYELFMPEIHFNWTLPSTVMRKANISILHIIFIGILLHMVILSFEIWMIYILLQFSIEYLKCRIVYILILSIEQFYFWEKYTSSSDDWENSRIKIHCVVRFDARWKNMPVKQKNLWNNTKSKETLKVSFVCVKINSAFFKMEKWPQSLTIKDHIVCHRK